MRKALAMIVTSNYKDTLFIHIHVSCFSGILTLLKHPYPRDVDEPDVYDSIRVHTEGGSKDDNEKPTFAVSLIAHGIS